MVIISLSLNCHLQFKNSELQVKSFQLSNVTVCILTFYLQNFVGVKQWK